MKLIGKLRDYFFTDKNIIVQFEIPKHYLKSINRIDKERLLQIDIQDKKSQRTLQQNAYIWALIHEIDRKENGSVSKESEMELYRNLIKMARVRIDYLQTIPEALETLQNTYRVVEEIESRISEKGVETNVYACYRGTSQFNKEEMSDFVEVILQYANNLGIDITYYERELK